MVIATRDALWFSVNSDLNGTVPGIELPESPNGPAATPYPGCSVRYYAACVLQNTIVKKFQDDVDEELTSRSAFAKFIAANEEGKDAFAFGIDHLGPGDSALVGEFKKAVWDFFNPDGMPLLDWSETFNHVDFGPGSSPGCDELTFVAKLGHSELTTSRELLSTLFFEWVKRDPRRVDAEIGRINRYGPPKVVKGVKITPVPKDAKTARLVKPEPSLNMFFQKGAAELIRKRLKEVFHIDSSIQPELNKLMAWMGSRYGTFATIDLSSASDYISRGLCREVIPRPDFTLLDSVRSTYCLVPTEIFKELGEELGLEINLLESDVDGYSLYELHMMCTMGNDFCFPLQTAIFACAVTAAYKTLGLPVILGSEESGYSVNEVSGSRYIVDSHAAYLPGNFSVHGDDIIVVDQAYDTVLRLLRAIGGHPNGDKSFSQQSGSFRESCGADFYLGENVRGVYCKTLKTPQNVYSLINELIDWQACHNIVLRETMEYLLSLVERIEVPVWENPDAGIRMPLSCVRNPIRAQSREKPRVKLGSWSPLYGPRLRAMGKWDPPNTPGSYIYTRYVVQPVKKDVNGQDANWDGLMPDEDWESDYPNQAAVHLAVVKGACRGGVATLRTFVPTYKKRLALAPSWDSWPGKTKPRWDWNVYQKVCEMVLA